MSLLKLDPDFKPAFDGPKIAQELVRKILQVQPLQRAILFGSSAIGKNTVNSDLDILLVIADGRIAKDYYSVVHQPFFSPISVDWIIKTEQEFQAEVLVGGVCMMAAQTGLELDIHDTK